jgi:hypothetical protein
MREVRDSVVESGRFNTLSSLRARSSTSPNALLRGSAPAHSLRAEAGAFSALRREREPQPLQQPARLMALLGHARRGGLPVRPEQARHLRHWALARNCAKTIACAINQ